MVSRWRDRHQQALFIVDQFEELYTLNPSEIQEGFSRFLRRLVDDGDVHVLLSMRDDFLYRCHAQDSLRPVFDGLLPLEQPGHEGLHRALVEPAQRLGFVFEDEGLLGEMISEVEGERGALPLLAFAVARLWEKRDRERLPMVREIFKNLVTSEGTRSVRSIEEMLTVFPDSSRADAVQVLHRLVDVRLLTSFEEEGTEGHGRRRIEVVHETLLSSWPRLVRWQTQDADAAQLRDQLRQAARTWDEHDRTADFLWTGKAYREFSVWRENYPGGLTELEEDFASAMTTHAKRRRRRRRVAVATLIAVLVGGLAVVGSFWRRSVRETRRAEAQKLFALAQIEIDNDRTASLAYTIKSLEMTDEPEVRKLAVEALWRGPSKFIIDESPSWSIPFSPDGRRLVKSEESSEGLHLEVLSSDGARLELGPIHGNNRVNVNISPGGEFFTSWDWNIRPEPKTVALWSMSESKPLATHKYEGAVRIHSTAWNERRLILLVIEDGVGNFDTLAEDGSHRRLGALTATGYKSWTMDSKTGRWLGAIQEDDVVVFEIRDTNLGEPRRLGRHPGVIRAEFHPRGDFLVTWSKDGEIRFWDPTGSSELKTLEAPGSFLAASLMGDGALLVAWMQQESEEAATLWSLEGETPRLLRRYVGRTPDRGPWDPVGWRFPTSSRQGGLGLLLLSAPPGAEPIPIVDFNWTSYFHPHGDWLSTTGLEGSLLWNLARPFSVVIARLPQPVFDLEFEREGRFLAAAGGRNYWMRLWPLEGDVPKAAATMLETREHGHLYGVAVSPDGEQLLVSTQVSGALLMPVSGGPARVLKGLEDAIIGGAFSPSGRLAAVPTGRWSSDPPAVHLWDVGTGRHVEAVETGSNPYRGLHFYSEDILLVATETGFMKLGLDGRSSEQLLDGRFSRFAVSRDGRRALLLEGDNPAGGGGRAVVFDIEAGEAMPLTSHGSDICAVSIDDAGSIAVTGNTDGEIRVGPITGEEPYLLLGHSGVVAKVAVDPLGRWIASNGHLGDLTVRLWPMPDLSKPPLHSLPHDELIAKLKTLTNLRVVRDEESATGWKLTHDPFPGWETVPTW